MPEYEFHLGGEFRETPSQVVFTLVVRDGTGKVDLGVVQVTVPKPLTETSLRQAMLTAARSLGPGPNAQEYVQALMRRINEGS